MFAIFEFVHALVETPKFRGAVKAGLSDLMYYIVLYMQITEEQVSHSSIWVLFLLINLCKTGIKHPNKPKNRSPPKLHC